MSKVKPVAASLTSFCRVVRRHWRRFWLIGRSGTTRSAKRLCIVELYVLRHRTLVVILTPDRQEPLMVRLDLSAEDLRSLGDRIVSDFAASNINPARPEWSTDLSYLEELGAKLAAVLSEVLDEVDVLCLVPHSHLFHLPLHALRLESGRYLIEEKPVVYAPSATLLKHARSLRTGRRPEKLLGLGVGREGDPPARKQSFEDEVSGLAELSCWSDARTLLGGRARKQDFFTACRDFDVIHFSCHGHFDALDPLASGLVLADSPQQALTAREISGLDLDLNLVFLSACVSGRHDIQPGDEIMGLTRSLIRAGAASIVVSLWPVAAAGSTRQLVHGFYERWLCGGCPKAEALQAAQLEVMKSFPHPYHWAPFVLFGDWV